MSVENFWIGKDIDIKSIWRDADRGSGYIDKFHTMRPHLLQIIFANPSPNLPLFYHEAIYKSFKFSYHELKRLVYSSDIYDKAGPLFLYSVDRGSSEYNFLSDLRQLLLYGTTLSDQKMLGQAILNLDSKIKLIEKYFGLENVHQEDFEAFINLKTPVELKEAFIRLYRQRIKTVKISQKPFSGNIDITKGTLVDLIV